MAMRSDVVMNSWMLNRMMIVLRDRQQSAIRHLIPTRLLLFQQLRPGASTQIFYPGTVVAKRATEGLSSRYTTLILQNGIWTGMADTRDYRFVDEAHVCRFKGLPLNESPSSETSTLGFKPSGDNLSLIASKKSNTRSASHPASL